MSAAGNEGCCSDLPESNVASLPYLQALQDASSCARSKRQKCITDVLFVTMLRSG